MRLVQKLTSLWQWWIGCDECTPPNPDIRKKAEFAFSPYLLRRSDDRRGLYSTQDPTGYADLLVQGSRAASLNKPLNSEEARAFCVWQDVQERTKLCASEALVELRTWTIDQTTLNGRFNPKLGAQLAEVFKEHRYDVTSIDLASLKLSTLPRILGFLPNLKTLRLSGNHTTLLPIEYGNLEQLERLKLLEPIHTARPEYLYIPRPDEEWLEPAEIAVVEKLPKPLFERYLAGSLRVS